MTKTKNGFRIALDTWGSEIVITRISTEKIVGRQTFSDHIQAVIAYKKL